MKDIEKMAEALAEKNSYVRVETEKLMELWENISECAELISSTTPIFVSEFCDYYLVTGQKEIKHITSDPEFLCDYDSGMFWWNALSMADLRETLHNFAIATTEIIEKMKKCQRDNSEVTALIKKLI